MTESITEPTLHYAYLFEAHSIQRYVLQGGKLAEMVGASELLEQLTGASGLLDDVLQQLQLIDDRDYQFSRRGGGAFFILFREAENAQALRDLWSLIVPDFSPGLEWNHVIAQGKNQQEAIKQGKEQLSIKRNHPVAFFPEANPLIRRNPRTNAAALCMIADKEGKPTSLDKATLAKLGYTSQGRKKKTHEKPQNSLLFNKFIIDKALKKDWVFPLNLEHNAEERVFPYRGDDHTIAIIHADGNGLGQILINLAHSLQDEENYAQVFYELSQKIDQATQAAAQQALVKMVTTIKEDNDPNHLSLTPNKKAVLPLRPLVLGGDDLTIIVRGDLALDYVDDFLIAFEETTAKELQTLHEQYPQIPSQMTACAGVAFIRSNQPFYLGYQLAESLCEHAKQVSKASKMQQDKHITPSSLAFYHVTTSIIDTYNVIQQRELRISLDRQQAQHTHQKPQSCYLSLGAYGTGQFAEELPHFSTLRTLKNDFQQRQLARGAIRHLLTLLFTQPNDATIAYRRWREVTHHRNEESLHLFDKACKDLLMQDINREDLPVAQLAVNTDNADNADKTELRTFLNDLVSWLAIEGEQ